MLDGRFSSSILGKNDFGAPDRDQTRNLMIAGETL